MTIDKHSIGPTLEALSDIIADIDHHNECLKSLNERKAEIERALLAFADDTGLDSFATSGMSIFVRDKMRAKYDPEKWDNVVKWAVENDKTFIVQRRLSDAKIADMFEAGETLPDGLSVEPFQTIQYRRK